MLKKFQYSIENNIYARLTNTPYRALSQQL